MASRLARNIAEREPRSIRPVQSRRPEYPGLPRTHDAVSATRLEAESSRDEPPSDGSDYDHYSERVERLAPGHVGRLTRLELQTNSAELPPYQKTVPSRAVDCQVEFRG